MFRRTLSVLLTLAILATLLVPAMGVSANTETIDIADYTRGEIVNSYDWSSLKSTARQSYLDGTEATAAMIINYSGSSVASFDLVYDNYFGKITTETNKGRTNTFDYYGELGGVFQNVTSVDPFNKGESWVIKARIKNISDEGITPKFGAGLSSTIVNYSTYSRVVGDVVDVTARGDEWQTYTGTVMVAEDTAANSTNTGYLGSYVNMGYPSNSPTGSKVRIERSTIYIAKEVAFDIENELSSTKALPGSIVTGNAKIVNQLGEKGNLDQTMTYFVTDKSGVIAEGFTVTAGENGAYEVAVGDSVEDGNYVVLARSSAYNTDKTENLLQAPVMLTVKSEDYSDTADLEVEDALVSGASSIGFDTFGVTWANTTDNIYSFTAVAPQKEIPNAIDNPAGGMVWSLANTGITKGDTYIITFKVKKNNTGSVVPNLVYGLVDGAMGVDYVWKVQNVYTLDVADTEWQTVVTEATVPSDGTKNTKFILGLGVGSTRTEYKGKTAFEFRDGASILVDMDSLCVVKDGVKGIVNSATTSTNVYAGGKIEAKAAVVNSANLTGDLDQTIEYVVLDAATRKKPASGITVTVGEDGNYTVNVSKSAQAGNYVVVASNSTNGSVMRKGLEFTVDTIDKYTTDYEPGTKPASLYSTSNMGASSICGFTTVRDKVNDVYAGTYTVTAPAVIDTTGDNATFIASAGAPDSGYYATTKNAADFVSGTTYVLSFRVKNANPAVPTKVVYGLVDGSMGGSSQNYAWKNQYVWSEDITGEDWYTITKVFTISLNGTASTQLHIGLGMGNTHSAWKSRTDLALIPNSSLTIDYNSVYFEEQVVYDMKVSAEKTTVRSGGTLTANASAVNQVGDESTFSQNFSWVALNSAKTDVAEGITVTTGADTSVATVSVSDDVAEGTYVIAAYSEDYDMAKSMVITVSNKVSVENIAFDSATGKVTFDALNVPEGGLTAKVYIAEYTEGGTKLEQAEEIPVTLSEGNNLGAEAVYTKNFNEDNLIKIFVWKSDLTPLAEEVEVKKN